MGYEVMALKKPKDKGYGFQREIAAFLNEKLKPYYFISTSQSGARVGGKNFAKDGHKFGNAALSLYAGDVACTNENEIGTFPFSIECKFYKTAPTLPQVLDESGNLKEWWEQAYTDALKCKKQPLLVMKWNRTATVVMVTTEWATKNKINMTEIKTSMQFNCNSLGSVWITKLEDFPWSAIAP